MNILHQSGEIINTRYQIIQSLGQGGSAITYKADDLQTKQKVVLKVLSLKQINDWKKIELFEREANILQKINHPQIPRYLDYFQIDTSSDRLFYLVQELAIGTSLATLVQEGWQPNEHELGKIAIQLLEILCYLQVQNPPIFHRDIKPENIIYDQNKNYDINLFLVDFGAVQNTFRNSMTASTIVGTYGYMSPEQLRGKANCATDLYGLGTTLIFLLTGKHPAEIPQKNLKFQFNNYSKTKILSRFSKWIKILIEPNYKNRFLNAQVALDALEGEHNIGSYLYRDKPDYTSIHIREITEDKFIIDIPAALFCNHYNKFLLLLVFFWYLTLFLTIFGISSSQNYGLYFWLIGIIYTMYVVITGLGEMFFSSQKIMEEIRRRKNIVSCFLGTFLFLSHNGLILFVDHFISHLRIYLLKELCFKKTLYISKNSGYPPKLRRYFFYISAIDCDNQVFGFFLTKAEKKWLLTELDNFLNYE